MAHCKAAGMSDAALAQFVKPPKGPSKPKGAVKATGSARKPVSVKPTTEPAKPVAAMPHPVLTETGPKVVGPVTN